MLEFYPNPNNLIPPGMLPPIDSQNASLPNHLSNCNQPAMTAGMTSVPVPAQNQQPPHHPHHNLYHQQQQQQGQPPPPPPPPSSNPPVSLSSCVGQTDVGQIKCEKTYELCEGCGLKIQDRFLMRVVDTSWHESCLACSVCNIPLNHVCYSRNSKIYCKDDYYRIFGLKCSRECSRCGERILPHEMVMRVNPHVYHLHCFVCFACSQPLQKGEQFTIRGGQLICRMDLEKDLYLAQHYVDEDLLMDEHLTRRDGRRGPKRPRTILTSAQRRQFKASFEVSPKPCRKIREALAKDTGLSVRVVQVWFQNQRAKMKKIQRKAKNGEDKKGDDSGKDEKSIKQESPNSEHGHYLMDSSFSSSSQPLNPNLPFSPDDYPGNSGDSICSSDISLDGSNFDHLDEGTSDTLQNLDFHHNHNNNSSCENNNHVGQVAGNPITHIDKLYLMQSSYFNGIEQ